MKCSSRIRVIIVATVTLLFFAPDYAPLAAQQTSRLFPSREYMPHLLAAPREPVTGAKFVWNSDSPNEYGDAMDGEVALGTSLPLYLISGNTVTNGLVVGAEAAVFGRFTLTNITKDLITTDWVFAVPLTLHRGDHWYQLRYHHLSSHLGDEYIGRFNAEVENFGRDAIDLTAFRRLAHGLGIYGSLNWSFNVHPINAERFITRLGFEYEPGNGNGAMLPYAAADVQWEQDNAWEPRLNLHLGVRLPELSGRRLVRLALEFFAGPSAQGQFHEEHVRHIALGMYINH